MKADLLFDGVNFRRIGIQGRHRFVEAMLPPLIRAACEEMKMLGLPPLRVKDGYHFVDMCIDPLENLPRHDVAFWKN